MAAKKAARKAVGRPFAKNDPRINRTKPGTGRPPDAFKAMCRDLSSSAEVEQAVRLILTNSKHPAFVGALKWASENGYGKPPQALELTGPNGGPMEVRSVVMLPPLVSE